MSLAKPAINWSHVTGKRQANPHFLEARSLTMEHRPALPDLQLESGEAQPLWSQLRAEDGRLIAEPESWRPAPHSLQSFQQ
jgi:hypothetical protein